MDLIGRLTLALLPLALSGLAMPRAPANTSGNSGRTLSTTAAAPNPLFGQCLALAIQQLDGREESAVRPRSVHLLPPVTEPGSSQILAAPTGHCMPVTMDQNTCQSTCSLFMTCSSSMMTCTSTCNETGRYPTCNSGGSPTSCGQKTCMSYPTCQQTVNTCSTTCTAYPTCNGSTATACTETCSSGNNQFPTCTASCSMYATCDMSSKECSVITMGEWATCNATSNTCGGGGACAMTASGYATCVGSSPTICGDTCSSHPTCELSTCEQVCRYGPQLLSNLGPQAWPQFGLMLALTGLVVTRRKKLDDES